MTANMNDLREQLNKSLQDESKPLGQTLGKLEVATGVPRLYIFIGGIAVVIIWLIFGFAAMLLCNLISFAYPAYMSMHAIESPRTDDDKKWLTYWVVFATFSISEFFVDLLVRYIPLYWLLKCVFFVWLMIPTEFNGSIIIYNKVIRPNFLKHQGEIDAALDKGVKAAGKLLNKDQ